MEARIILVALFALFLNTGSCDFSSHITAKNTELEEPEVNPLCPAEEDPKNPTVLPYPNDCSKFYKCLHGKAYPISCPQGLHFSAELQRCDWPEVAGCDHNVATTKTPEGSTPTATPLPPTSPGSTAEPPKLNPLCPADDDPKNPTVLPDPDDCSKFFKCLNRVAYPVLCPQGLHWSKKLQRCDWPEVAECDPKIPTTKTPEGTTSPGTPLPPVSTTPRPDGPKKDSRCPENEDPKQPTALPYPGDCSKFYKCLNGMAYPVACPVGLHWSTTLNRCDWPEVAKCDPNVKEPADKHDLKEPLKKEEITTSMPTTTIMPTSVTPPIHEDCPETEDPNKTIFLPNPNNCSKFFKCVNRRGYPMECPSGLHFSLKLGRCDWPEVAGCDPNIRTTATPRTTPTPKPTTTPVPTVPLDCPPNEDPENPTVLPYPGDCSKFYKCLSGRAYPIACPAGLHYSPDLGRCDWPEIAKCDPNIKVDPKPTVQPEITSTTPVSVSPTPQAPTEKLILPGNQPKTTKSCKGQNQLIAHEDDCTKFIQCAGDQAVEKSCPGGTHFNAQFMVCDYPERAGCQGGLSKNTQPETIVAEISSTTGTPAEATTPRKEINQENVCEGVSDNTYLQHPQDCSRYVHCYNKQMFIQQCPPGLLWNHQSNYCDYKEKVNCNN